MTKKSIRTHYHGIEQLHAAIERQKEQPEQLTAYLDGGEVFIHDSEGIEVFASDERTTLIEMLYLFLGVKHEEI